MKTSLLGAINLLELARNCRAKILQASTSEVYGDPEVHPQREDYRGAVNPIGPRSCYDEGKRAAESLFMDEFRMYGTKICVARIFNTYGPKMHPYDGRVVSNFIRQALTDEPITIFGDGSQTRSFCYYDDLLDGLIRLMEDETGFVGPVNLGNPNEFTIRELGDLVWKTLGKEPKFVFKELPVDDPCRRRPDISLAKEKLGWEPKVQIEEGLRKTVEWFRSIDVAEFRPPTPNY
jgi:UDP-glucuronate decarboxylase